MNIPSFTSFSIRKHFIASPHLFNFICFPLTPLVTLYLLVKLTFLDFLKTLSTAEKAKWLYYRKVGNDVNKKKNVMFSSKYDLKAHQKVCVMHVNKCLAMTSF